jgi:HEPN domain-containing protein
MEKVVREWLETSDYDLETADAMLKAGRYLYVLFMCQQAVEKLLKAVFVKNKNELPPRVHNLSYLADSINLEVTDSERSLLNELNQFYLESRYPVERARLAGETDGQKAGAYLERTKEIVKCLKEKHLSTK